MTLGQTAKDVYTCDGCGIEMQEKDICLAYNIGAGPEYYCLKCKPSGTADQTIAEIKTVMGRTK